MCGVERSEVDPVVWTDALARIVTTRTAYAQFVLALDFLYLIRTMELCDAVP